MKIDDDTKQFIKLRLENNAPEVEDLSPIELREMRASMAAVPPEHQVQINHIKDITIKSENRDLKLREYSNNNNDDQPLIIFFHGGGFVMGDLDSHDLLCRHLTKKSECKLIAIDYSLAPENKFPCSLEDSINAVNYIFENHKQIKFNQNKVVVCGDSAGGNLAASLCIKRKQEELSMPKAQLLIYPVTDLALKHPSMDEMAEGFFLTKTSMEFFRNQYLENDELTEDPLVSPLYAEDLSDHPPAVVVTAGFDPLRDEGDQYAQALRQANVEIYHRTHDSYIHGFVNMMLVNGVDYALKRICDDFKKIF